MGIGNILKGDDGVGIYIANKFKKERKDWLVLNCGTAPENFTSEIKREKPQYLVIVDAAELSLKPGEFRIIPKEKISSLGFGTHSMQLSQLISYLKNYAEKIIFIGIQTKNRNYGKGISNELKTSAKKIIEILKKEEFEKFKEV